MDGDDDVVKGVSSSRRGPAEKALERAVEGLGAAAANTAASLLRKGLQLPIRVAVQALDRALDLVRDLGLGR